MKLRVLPILFSIIGVTGIVLFILMPVTTAKARFIDIPTDTDFTFQVNAYFRGDGDNVVDGMVLGNPEHDEEYIGKDEWDTYMSLTEPYPDIVIYLSLIGLGLATLGIFLSIFGGNSGLRIAGALLGFIGGGLGIAGCFMLYNWNSAFQTQAEIYLGLVALFTGTTHTITWSTFGIGWFFAVCSCGLIAVGSIILLVIKPKGK